MPDLIFVFKKLVVSIYWLKFLHLPINYELNINKFVLVNIIVPKFIVSLSACVSHKQEVEHVLQAFSTPLVLQ